jgi:phosphoenolpyruvate---glycerone phosphotransferase subunit DhaM
LVGIVVVSHSADLAAGIVDLAVEMAGSEVRIERAGGSDDGRLGTSEDLIRAAIKAADQGSGVVVLGDLGSAFLTVRSVLQSGSNGNSVRVADAPLVEGAIAAAVSSSAGQSLDEVADAAEETRGAKKL